MTLLVEQVDIAFNNDPNPNHNSNYNHNHKYNHKINHKKLLLKILTLPKIVLTSAWVQERYRT